MIVDNGRHRQLIISNLFDGICGESERVLSFIPNQAGRRPEDARSGLLDGEAVLLFDVNVHEPFVSCQYRAL